MNSKQGINNNITYNKGAEHINTLIDQITMASSRQSKPKSQIQTTTLLKNIQKQSQAQVQHVQNKEPVVIVISDSDDEGEVQQKASESNLTFDQKNSENQTIQANQVNQSTSNCKSNDQAVVATDKIESVLKNVQSQNEQSSIDNEIWAEFKRRQEVIKGQQKVSAQQDMIKSSINTAQDSSVLQNINSGISHSISEENQLSSHQQDQIQQNDNLNKKLSDRLAKKREQLMTELMQKKQTTQEILSRTLPLTQLEQQQLGNEQSLSISQMNPEVQINSNNLPSVTDKNQITEVLPLRKTAQDYLREGVSKYLILPRDVCYKCKTGEKLQQKSFVNPYSLEPPILKECISCQLQSVDLFNQCQMKLGSLAIIGVPQLGKDFQIHTLQFEVNALVLLPNEKIQIRCIKLGSKFEYECEFPPGYSVKVNNRKRTDVPPRNSMMAGRRRDFPFDIQDELNKKNTYQKIEFHSSPYEKYNDCKFIFGIFRAFDIENEDIDVIVSQLYFVQKSLGALITVRSFEENLIHTESIRTKCQYLSSNTIRFPGRGKLCTHFQCFDLGTYLTMNKKSLQFKCPVCNKRAVELYHDLFFKEILDTLTQDELTQDNPILIESDLKLKTQNRILNWDFEEYKFLEQVEKVNENYRKVTIIQQNAFNLPEVQKAAQANSKSNNESSIEVIEIDDTPLKTKNLKGQKNKLLEKKNEKVQDSLLGKRQAPINSKALNFIDPNKRINSAFQKVDTSQHRLEKDLKPQQLLLSQAQKEKQAILNKFNSPNSSKDLSLDDVISKSFSVLSSRDQSHNFVSQNQLAIPLNSDFKESQLLQTPQDLLERSKLRKAKLGSYSNLSSRSFNYAGNMQQPQDLVHEIEQIIQKQQNE
eukprot:403335843